MHRTYGHIYVQTLFGYICGYGNPDGSSAVTLRYCTVCGTVLYHWPRYDTGKSIGAAKRAEDVPCVITEPDVKNALAESSASHRNRTN
jgi:hypothetical protein